MKYIKIYLVIITILLIAGIGLGVYVWYTLQGLSNAANGVQVPGEEGTSLTDTPETSSSRPGVTIQTSDLPETQQKVLDGLGITGDSFTITPSMIECAENALGKARIDALVSGSAPTPLESLKLLPCVKK